MARINVYLPDELAENARLAGLNVSALTQAAVAAELQRRATNAWLDTIPTPTSPISHDVVMDALDSARTELGNPS